MRNPLPQATQCLGHTAAGRRCLATTKNPDRWCGHCSCPPSHSGKPVGDLDGRGGEAAIAREVAMAEAFEADVAARRASAAMRQISA